MTDIAEGVQAVLADWDDLPSLPGKCQDLDGAGWLVGGIYKGAQYVKHTGMVPDAPDSPDDPIEAAIWLDAHAKARHAQNTQSVPRETFSEPSHGFGVDEVAEVREAEEISQDVAVQDATEDAEEAVPLGETGDAEIRLHGSSEGQGDNQEALPEHAGSADRSDSEQRADILPLEQVAAYPGIAIQQLSDELSILRAQVIDMISAREEIRLDALVDPSRREDLTTAWKDAQNKGALGLPLSAQELDLREQYLVWQLRETTLRGHAGALRRSARDASLDILRSMAANVDAGWP